MSPFNIGDYSENGTRVDRRDELAQLLKIGAEGWKVADVTLHGDGPRAALDLALIRDGERRVIEAERLDALMAPAKLAAFVTTWTGVEVAGLKAAQSARAVALIRQLANVHDAMTDADHGRDYGGSYLKDAQLFECDLADQEQRWRGFSHLEGLHPTHDYRAGQAKSIAAAGPVLRDPQGTKYVRCDWLGAHVREAWSVSNSPHLVLALQRAGWSRRGKRGQIKATAPGRKETLILPFWLVPDGWDPTT